MGESRERKKMLDDWRRKWAQFVFAEEKRVRLLGFPMQNGEKIINLYLYIVKKKKKKVGQSSQPSPNPNWLQAYLGQTTIFQAQP